MKKVLAVLLSVCMVIGLAACGTTATEGTTAAATQAAATEAAATEAAATTAAAAAETQAAAVDSWKTEHPTWITPEKSEISVTTYDGVVDTYLPPSDDVWFWQWMEEMTNVHVNWDVYPYSSYNEIVSAKLSAGQDLSDVVALSSVNSVTDILAGLSENGIIADLAPNWDTNFKYTKAYWDASDELPYQSLITDANGSIWCLRATVNSYNNRVTGLWNKNWLDKLGLKVPETRDEAYATLKAFKEAGDLNGNGEADEICLTSPDMGYVISYFGSSFDVHEYTDTTITHYWEDGDGVIYDERTTDRMKDTLRFIHMLNEEGLFDQEVLSYDDDFQATTEKSTLGRYGCICIFQSFTQSYSNLLNKYYIEGYDESMLNTTPGLLIGPELASPEIGDKGQCRKDQSLSIGAVVTNSDKKDIAMQWLDFLFASPEAIRTLAYGPEGIGYELDANGEPQLIYDADGNWADLVQYGCEQISLPFIQTDELLNNPQKNIPWLVEDLEKFRAKTNFYVCPISDATPLPEEQEIISMYKTDVNSYWREMRNKFVSGDADLDKDWDNYIATMKAVGMDEMVSAYQSFYNRNH